MLSKISFVFGVIIGWMFRLLVDRSFVQTRSQRLPVSANDFQQERASLEAELATSRKAIQTLREKVRQLELEKAEREIPPAPAHPHAERTYPSPVQKETDVKPAPTASSEPVVPDRLEEIKGIGTVIARLLNQNGIFTFDQLAAQSPEDLRVILGDVIKRLTNEEALIEQARLLALRKQNKTASEL